MKELTHEDWMKNPIPRKMWVWNDNDEAKIISLVSYVMSDKDLFEYSVMYKVIAFANVFKHCAEIEKPIKRPCTREELLEMLKKQGLSLLKLKGDTENYTVSIRSLNDREITLNNG